jgi:RND family efflux transporter MFP subunit
MKRYMIFGAIATILVAGVTVARCSSGAEAADTPADSVRAAVLGPDDVASVARRDLIEGVPVSGTLQPALEVRIASPIPEVLDAVLVKEGQAVRRGEVLARFRTNVVGPAALSATAQRQKAEADSARMQNLYTEGAVSEQDVENALVTLRVAQAAEAAAQKRLDESTVRAPFSGVISQRAVDSGDRVKDGDFLFQLVNTSELEFEATLPSEYAGRVRPGAPAVLTVSGLDSGVTGNVARVNATVDEATRQVKIYLSVPNPGGRIVGGLFASGRIVLRGVHDAVAVPASAVRVGPDGHSYVLLIEGGQVARRDVTTGAVDEQASAVEITAGLQGGETVIVGPASGLEVGEPVTVSGAED